MVLLLKKGIRKAELDKALRGIKHSKKLNARQHVGKVKWGEDALEYQKKIRSEWD